MVQDVARMLMLGTELTQMPAWYVDLSHAQAMESHALLLQCPDAAGIQHLKQGMSCSNVWDKYPRFA